MASEREPGITLEVDLRTAAMHLGVHYQTAYRWVREGVLSAVKVGSSYEVSDEEVQRCREARARPGPPPRQTHVRDWQVHVERLHRLLLEGDELPARQLVDRLHDGGIDPLALCERLLAPVLRGIGEGWERGEVSVAEEHRASAICERIVARIATHPRGRPRGVCVVATPPGEEHGLPAAMAATVLRADRWQVHHLGTEVPDDALVALAEREGADLVVLSVTTPDAEAVAEVVAGRVRAAGARALVGRPGLALAELVERARAERS